jgi:hypothetical protein
MVEGGGKLPVGLREGCLLCLRAWWQNEELQDRRRPPASRDIVGCYGCCSSRATHNKIGADENQWCRWPKSHFGSTYFAQQQKIYLYHQLSDQMNPNM